MVLEIFDKWIIYFEHWIKVEYSRLEWSHILWNTYGEMVYFLLICIAAILESAGWIPTQQNIKRNIKRTCNSEIFLPHLVLYITQYRIGMC